MQLGWATEYCPFCGKPKPAVDAPTPVSPKPEPTPTPPRQEQHPPQPRPVPSPIPPTSAVKLTRGGNISLSKHSPNLSRILVGLGWKALAKPASDFELEASVFMTVENGKVRGDEDFIFYNQLKSPCGSVELIEDSKAWAKEGYVKVIKVNLSKLPSIIQRLSVSVTIFEAEARRQNFGQVKGAYIRIVAEETGVEIARFDLSDNNGTETAMIFGEIYRRGAEWKFKAVGQGYVGGLETLCHEFGVNVG